MYNAYVVMYVGLCVHKPANVFALLFAWNSAASATFDLSARDDGL